MKIMLKKQTTWGCTRHLTVYKNDLRQTSLVNNITLELAVEVGDCLTFRDGLYKCSQKIIVTPETKEITIATTAHAQLLFLSFLLLFLVVSFFFYSFDSAVLFFATEMGAFLFLHSLFRVFSYQICSQKKRQPTY